MNGCTLLLFHWSGKVKKLAAGFLGQFGFVACSSSATEPGVLAKTGRWIGLSMALPQHCSLASYPSAWPQLQKLG